MPLNKPNHIYIYIVKDRDRSRQENTENYWLLDLGLGVITDKK